LKRAGKKKGTLWLPSLFFPDAPNPKFHISECTNQVERASSTETCRKRLARPTQGALQGRTRPPPLACAVAAHQILFAQNVLREKGLEAISVEELVKEITPRGRATVPDSLKAELLQRIRKFLAEN
jgi:hypothetical protein